MMRDAIRSLDSSLLEDDFDEEPTLIRWATGQVWGNPLDPWDLMLSCPTWPERRAVAAFFNDADFQGDL